LTVAFFGCECHGGSGFCSKKFGWQAARPLAAVHVKQLSYMSNSVKNALGLYISIPFCRTKCTYCNFASGVYPASDRTRYVDRLTTEMVAAGAWAERMGVALPRRVDTVYLGGGTPNLLAPELLARLFMTVHAEFDLDPDAEVTVECAPGQLRDEMLQVLVASGVNRVSLGVQSFIDREVAGCGRHHNRAVALEDIARLRAAGIDNLNVDLIAGLPGQTLASWQESLEVLVAAQVPHASVYMLEVDEDSRLGREVIGGGTRYHAGLVPTDEAIVRMYAMAIDRLKQAGLEQYEISNFSRPGMQSRHNLRYWRRRPYLGLGLDASSMLREAPAAEEFSNMRVLRSTTTDDLKAYLAGTEPVETSWLTPARQHEEAWFLGLRLNIGVEVAAVEREFGVAMVAPALKVVTRLVEAELLVSDGKTVRLTPRGQLFSNDVFQEFLDLEENAGAKAFSGLVQTGVM
jgi:oxygen-independent coproporphyrinogen III oxidase